MSDATGPMAGSDASPRTVLIVDDTPQNLTVLGELLQPEYRVRAANTGERALRAAATLPRPDIILLDIMMPGMDGYEVLGRLRADASTRDIPVIFITAMSAEADEERGLELGAVDYITKPFNPAIVLARVRAQLELKEARDRLARQNEWLEAEVLRRVRENLLIQDMSMKALAILAETRDMETGLHVMRTQIYVELLARHLAGHPRFAAALDEKSLNMIVKAAPLHDIGKIGIPDAVLLKPGRLDAEEFATMQTHAAIGARAIERAMAQAVDSAGDITPAQSHSAFAFMHVAREIALSHHEKWDGSGYPAGLAGEAIPPAARLMALADVFDALTCRRVYKPPLPFDEAVGIITAGRGRHFDVDVVDAFLALREEFAAVATRFADPEPGAGQ